MMLMRSVKTKADTYIWRGWSSKVDLKLTRKSLASSTRAYRSMLFAYAYK